MANNTGSTTSGSGFVRAATQTQDSTPDRSGRAAPDERRGFEAQREGGFGGGAETRTSDAGPGNPDMREAGSEDMARLPQRDLRQTESGDIEGRVAPGRPQEE